MSYQQAHEPVCAACEGDVSLVIRPKEKSLGEFSVRRVLPAVDQKMVGPFIFFDHMGPAELPPGHGIDVRPHPHIGIATITYLFEGEIMHRDSLGVQQVIRPGAVNLMTAGRGIVHSERAGSDLDQHSRLHGIQSWVALPDGDEEIDPAFEHYPASDFPELLRNGARVRVVIGEAYGHTSPVQAYGKTLYLDCILEAGTSLQLPEGYRELAAYVVEGEAQIGGLDYAAGVMTVAAAGRSPRVDAHTDSRIMVIGGDPIGARHIWWNFVSSSRERIEQAKQDWDTGAFDAIPGDDERIPLPLR